MFQFEKKAKKFNKMVEHFKTGLINANMNKTNHPSYQRTLENVTKNPRSILCLYNENRTNICFAHLGKNTQGGGWTIGCHGAWVPGRCVFCWGNLHPKYWVPSFWETHCPRLKVLLTRGINHRTFFFKALWLSACLLLDAEQETTAPTYSSASSSIRKGRLVAVELKGMLHRCGGGVPWRFKRCIGDVREVRGMLKSYCRGEGVVHRWGGWCRGDKVVWKVPKWWCIGGVLQRCGGWCSSVAGDMEMRGVMLEYRGTLEVCMVRWTCGGCYGEKEDAVEV